MDLVDRLVEHRTLGTAPRAELAWLAAHGSLRHAARGEVLSTKGERVEGLYVVLSGCIAISIDRGTGLRKAMEWRAGDVTGLLPYSRLLTPPGDTVAQEPTELLTVPGRFLVEMTRACYEVTAILVHRMLDRARVFNSSELEDERMISLGKLAAGLAHELNNPASAIERSSAQLAARLEDSEQSARVLGAAGLSPAQLAVIEDVRAASASTRQPGVASPVAQAEREEAIAEWLADHGVDTALAESLGDTAATLAALDRLVAAVDGPALSAVLHWTAASSTVRALAAEIQEAAGRISGLVGAIKGFTHMDQAAVAEPVDLARGLDNTVAVLRSKARAKSVTVTVEVESGLPCARGFAGELNQIWANLLDNALDAAPVGSQVAVVAQRDAGHIVVRVVDGGGGIPAEIQDKIFEPFFTTKPVGQGSGLGLDITRRLVLHNDGEITVA
jgi:signal transduction histidine kinase